MELAQDRVQLWALVLVVLNLLVLLPEGQLISMMDFKRRIFHYFVCVSRHESRLCVTR